MNKISCFSLEKYAMAKAIEINRKLKNPELFQPKPKEETSFFH